MRYSTVTSASATCPLVGRYCVCHVCIDYFLFGQYREIENLQQPLDMRSKKCRVRKARGEEGGKIREELAGILQARCLVFTIQNVLLFFIIKKTKLHIVLRPVRT